MVELKDTDAWLINRHDYGPNLKALPADRFTKSSTDHRRSYVFQQLQSLWNMKQCQSLDMIICQRNEPPIYHSLAWRTHGSSKQFNASILEY
jgi:hypothetical protein